MTCKECAHYYACSANGGLFNEKDETKEMLCRHFDVKVVRCKSCIYAEKHYDTTHLIGRTYFPSGVPTRLLYITCKYHKGKLAENDFCSYGEGSKRE